MSLAALTVLIVHLFVKPYEKMYINVIETAILLNLLMVTAAFLDPSGRPIPEWLSSILVVLPYLYAVGYVGWRISRTLWWVCSVCVCVCVRACVRACVCVKK